MAKEKTHTSLHWFLWHCHVTAKGEHLQMRCVFSVVLAGRMNPWFWKLPLAVGESTQALSTQMNVMLCQRERDMFSSLLKGLQTSSSVTSLINAGVDDWLQWLVQTLSSSIHLVRIISREHLFWTTYLVRNSQKQSEIMTSSKCSQVCF